MQETEGLNREVPLCVDLDGTLLRSDLLHESLSQLLLKRPWLVFSCLGWLVYGRAHFKREVARRVQLNPALLPYNAEFLEFLRLERQRGRQLVLASASDMLLLKPVAAWLGIFSAVFGSDGATNLSGRHKAEELSRRFGRQGFDYAGNSRADLAIWPLTRQALIVGGTPRLIAEARGRAPSLRVFTVEMKRLRLWLSAIRVHQWVKNLLLFVPLVMAHKIVHPAALWHTWAAFGAFCLCASSVYLINDLVDLEADRRHALKKNRPLASGSISQLAALGAAPLFLAGALALAWLVLSRQFTLILGLYFAATLFYSLYFKKLIVADIVILALLYSLRILAGGFAADVLVSKWLLAFSMFFFLSLACIKRYSELRAVRLNNGEGGHGRGYQASDLEHISQFGTASGYLSVLVLALYVSSPEVSMLYAKPQLIWLICPVLLYWISRMWLLAGRGQMHEDPILFAIGDKVSYLVGLAAVLILIVAV